MTAIPNSVDVAIVGAGPTGLTLAHELLRRGASVAVVEKRTERQLLSKALGVHARTLEVFDDFGIADAAVARGRRLSAARIEAEGTMIAEVPLAGIDSHYNFVLILPQHETEGLLESTLPSDVLRGVEVVGATQDADGVDLELRVGDHTSSLRARWVVGCDGAHSVVRSFAGISFDGSSYAETFALADLRLDWGRDPNSVHAFLGPDGLVAVFPLPQVGRSRLVADLQDTDPQKPSLALMQELLHRRGPKDARISDATWTSRFRIHRRVAGRYRSGRFLVAGDAAHVHSPVGGQGMNTGIQDAYNLGWKLALVLRGEAPISLLDSYEAERRPVAMATVRGTDLVTRFGLVEHRLGRAVRTRLASTVARFGPVRQRALQTVAELAVHYRRSPIVAAPMRAGGLGSAFFSQRVIAGDRCPDVPLADGARLHQRLRGVHTTVFVFAGGATSAAVGFARQIESVCGETVMVALVGAARDGRPQDIDDADGSVADRFSVSTSEVIVVRPDGYIALRTDELDTKAVAQWIPPIG